VESAPYKIKPKNNPSLLFANTILSKENFPVTHGITNYHHGDFKIDQENSDFEQEKNLILMNQEKCDCYYKINAEHSDTIKIIEPDGQVHNIVSCDGLIYFNNGKLRKHNPLLIGITADCPMVIMTDVQTKADKRKGEKNFIAVIHSGLQGTLKNIIGKALDIIDDRGISPSQVKALVWPGICQKCYQVNYQEFSNYFCRDFLNPRGYLNLKGVVLTQLFQDRQFKRGVHDIILCDVCPHHTIQNGHYHYFSHRRGDLARNAVFAHF
jgi:copper oxidase (laccase) domain-containing protein